MTATIEETGTTTSPGEDEVLTRSIQDRARKKATARPEHLLFRPVTKGTRIALKVPRRSPSDDRLDTTRGELVDVHVGAKIGWLTILSTPRGGQEAVQARCRCGRVTLPLAKYVMRGTAVGRSCGLVFDPSTGAGHLHF